jgi:hypothetical protein
MCNHLKEHTVENRIVELYQHQLSIKDIAKEVFGSRGSYRRVIRVLMQHPESGYIPHLAAKRKRKYIIDDNFFKVIDTEKKAYFFGLMAADGYIRMTNGNPTAVGLELKSDDIATVESFRDTLGDPTVPVVIRPAINASCEKAKVIFFSAKLARDLTVKLGTNKSLEMGAISHFVPRKLHPHFVRGVLDGDGSWGYEKYRLVLSFRGTMDFLEDLQSIIPEPTLLSIGNQKLPTLATRTHRAACRMYYWLYYDNPTVYMERKIKKAKSGLSLQRLKEKFRISVKAPQGVTPRDRPEGKPVTTTKERLSETMA